MKYPRVIDDLYLKIIIPATQLIQLSRIPNAQITNESTINNIETNNTTINNNDIFQEDIEHI